MTGLGAERLFDHLVAQENEGRSERDIGILLIRRMGTDGRLL